ncbi:hypothetical protein B2G52_03910 [Neisseria lactamica]|uniref:Uncharacterized protein n=2 Tax=Neisseria lactamica TaxID=486 RepID=A0AAU8VE79_NEILA|nr:hypothetical protein B2G52_03910 [Neisseria lactamica]
MHNVVLKGSDGIITPPPCANRPIATAAMILPAPAGTVRNIVPVSNYFCYNNKLLIRERNIMKNKNAFLRSCVPAFLRSCVPDPFVC